jgi:hypothetical protein
LGLGYNFGKRFSNGGGTNIGRGITSTKIKKMAEKEWIGGAKVGKTNCSNGDSNWHEHKPIRLLNSEY